MVISISDCARSCNMGPPIDKNMYHVHVTATMIHTGTSKCHKDYVIAPTAFFFCAAKYNFSARAQHIPSKLNLIRQICYAYKLLRCLDLEIW